MIAVPLAAFAFAGSVAAYPGSRGVAATRAVGRAGLASAARAGELGRQTQPFAPANARHEDPSRTLRFASRFGRHGRRRFDGFYDWPGWGWDGDGGYASELGGQDYGPPPEPRRWIDEAGGVSPAPICPEMLHWSVQSHTATRQRLC